MPSGMSSLVQVGRVISDVKEKKAAEMLNTVKLEARDKRTALPKDVFATPELRPEPAPPQGDVDEDVRIVRPDIVDSFILGAKSKKKRIRNHSAYKHTANLSLHVCVRGCLCAGGRSLRSSPSLARR